MQDSEIIELYIKRDERAISETDIKYGSYCKTIAYNILSDTFDAEECLNETYLKTWNSVPPTLPRILSAFLAKITRNLALDRVRELHSKKRAASRPDSLDELSECIGGRDISEDIELSAIGTVISDFLRGESSLLRRIFVRKYFFEDSVSTIAKSHGLTEANVKTTLHRMRKRLASYLEKEGIYI